MANVDNIHVGDKVQITKSAIDVTNGVKAGSRYVEGTSEWGYVQGVYPNWVAAYGSNKGLKVNKVRILGTDNSTVVWQVEPQHVSDNIIHVNNCAPVVETPAQAVVTTTAVVEEEKAPSVSTPVVATKYGVGTLPDDAFVTTPTSTTWRPPAGDKSESRPTSEIQTSTFSPNINSEDQPIFQGKDIRARALDNLTRMKPKRITAVPVEEISDQNKSKIPMADDIERIDIFNIRGYSAKRIILDDEQTMVQNEHGFPFFSSHANYGRMIPAKYDYRIQINDTRSDLGVSLEDQLMVARTALGIPVHGDKDKAKTMRYFLYNRFKSPDINMAHNKSFTHIFFTRPDLNILELEGNNPIIATQCKNHTEATMVWLRNPTLFKLLVDRSRSKDSNNFNMLLSNAVTSFTFDDENLTYLEAGRSWQEHAIQYGDSYSGRTAGEFSINFTDDKEYSIINMLKLWITYIDNVSRGAWLPSYNLRGRSNVVSLEQNGSHVYTKTLDYAASVYVFKVAEDGSDILYWTKYYGVFPINTGASALSWDLTQSPGEVPKLNIRFRYSYKRDLSPVSLLEFNNNANVSNYTTNNKVTYESQWSSDYNHSNRPYVGTPFVQLKIPKRAPEFKRNQVLEHEDVQLRLQFQPANVLLGENLDATFYRYGVTGGTTVYTEQCYTCGRSYSTRLYSKCPYCNK